ncbi:hypothetical protein FGK64_13005 [Arenibacterium halophilum]|uniref:Secreted protein n=2 Tax=Arenibacterium halophilum TaxID=2583821 RepID=A0ABY2XD45_9RHOB|nr:hypothetical protein FGK64_13005 [Arenibacterium halophilum]
MTRGGLGVNSIVTGDGRAMIRVMKPWFVIAALAAFPASCGPYQTYYKQGVEVSRLNRDQTQCEVNALRDAPVATQIRQNPPVFVPPRQGCDSNGTCYTRPGYWASGGVYTVDVNEQLRARVLDMCMVNRGYQPVSIPRCSGGVAAAAPDRKMTTLPRLTSSSCAIPRPDGTWQIVNAG